jgi:hypothetical protein
MYENNGMVALRCTRKLLQRARLKPADTPGAPTTRLGDWYATVLPFRKPLVLALSEKTLAGAVWPLAPANSVLSRWPEAVRDLLLALTIPPEAVAAEVLAMEEMAAAVTTSRRVVGCLNEAVATLKWLGAPSTRSGLLAVGLRLARNTYSVTDYELPADAVYRAFGVAERPESKTR